MRLIRHKTELFIDPGLHSAGWAVFGSADYPLEAGLVRSTAETQEEDILERANYVGDQLMCIAQAHNAERAYIEFPVFYGESDSRAGSIFKLCACIGAISGALHSRGVRVQSVLVPQWKGQLPKAVVIKRIKLILGDLCEDLKLKADMWDAVGIGLYKRGLF